MRCPIVKDRKGVTRPWADRGKQHIEAGCNGVKAVLLRAAAVIAYPSSIKLKVLGIFIGVFAIQAVNLMRIITLTSRRSVLALVIRSA